MLLANEEIFHVVASVPIRMLQRNSDRQAMNPAKQHRKLHKLLSKAEICLTRDEAQKILKKAAKTQKKLEKGPQDEIDTQISF